MLNIDELRRLYADEGLSLAAIAARHGCSLTTIWRRLDVAGIPRREGGSSPLHVRTNFSGTPGEMAYLIGLRLGDLNVERESERTIVVKCTSTRPEQVDLFRGVFSGYGHVYTDELTLAQRKRQSIGMEVRLNNTFAFLLPKQDAIPEWILPNDATFYAFLAGYVDAEGYFKVYIRKKQPLPSGQLELRSYDANLLGQLRAGLMARGILCPPAQLCVRAGYVNRAGVRSNKDLWRLGVNRYASLQRVIAAIEPYLRHARRRRHMVAVVDRVLSRYC